MSIILEAKDVPPDLLEYFEPISGSRPDVWKVSTQGFPEAHFATYPEDLITPCIKAGTSHKGCCPECGTPWVRIIEKERRATRPGENTKIKIPGGWDTGDGAHGTIHREGRTEAEYRETSEVGNRDPQRHVTESKTIGWEPGCGCFVPPDYIHECAPTTGNPCVVLDPFVGSGTTGVVALRQGCNFIGIELSETYAAMARRRIESDAPLLNELKDGPQWTSHSNNFKTWP